jgi:hypothetical protein
MADLHRAGKIRAIGVSNFSPAQMNEFRVMAPLHTAQPPYNLFERAVERDVMPYCREHRLVMLAYGSLCRGLLSGKMTINSRFTGDDRARTTRNFRRLGLRSISPRSRHLIDSRTTTTARGSSISRFVGCSTAAMRMSPCGVRGDPISWRLSARPWAGASTSRHDRDRAHPPRHNHQSGRTGVHGASRPTRRLRAATARHSLGEPR